MTARSFLKTDVVPPREPPDERNKCDPARWVDNLCFKKPILRARLHACTPARSHTRNAADAGGSHTGASSGASAANCNSAFQRSMVRRHLANWSQIGQK